MHELAVPVTHLYIILSILLLFFTFQAKVLLLGLIYLLVVRRLQIRLNKSEKAFPGLQWLHGIVTAVLAIIWLVSGYFQIRTQIFQVLFGFAVGSVLPADWAAIGSLLPQIGDQKSPFALPYAKLSAAFRIVVLLAAVEILGLAAFLYDRTRRSGVTGKVSPFRLSVNIPVRVETN